MPERSLPGSRDLAATFPRAPGCDRIDARPKAHLGIGAALAALLACLAFALPAAAAAPPRLDQAVSLAPHLLLIHGGSFLFDDPLFEPLTRQAALEAGFVPHYLSYPLGDLAGAVTAARAEARALGERYPGRLYAYGSSVGGTLAALLAGDGMLRAAVAKAPPTDLLGWEWPLLTYGSDYYEGLGADPAARLRLSPLRRRAERPLLVVQGRADRVVPLAMNVAFAAKFKRVHLWVVPGGHHTERTRAGLLASSLAWLAREADTEAR